MTDPEHSHTTPGQECRTGSSQNGNSGMEIREIRCHSRIVLVATSHPFSFAISPLPPRLMKRLLHRREQVFHDAARAEVDLGGHLHARRQRKRLAVGNELLRIEFDQRPVDQALAGRIAFRGVGLRRGVLWLVLRVGTDVHHPPVEHAGGKTGQTTISHTFRLTVPNGGKNNCGSSPVFVETPERQLWSVPGFFVRVPGLFTVFFSFLTVGWSTMLDGIFTLDFCLFFLGYV